MLLFSRGQPREALAIVAALLEREPANADALNIAGACARRLGQLDAAEAYWRRALKEDPDFADVHSNLGNLLRVTRRFPEAEERYRRALAIQPDHAEAQNNLGVLLQEMERPGEAEAAYRQAIAIRPDHANAHNNLGNLLRVAKRYSAAETAYRQALAIRPDHAEVHHNLGILLRDADRLFEAEAAYRRALTIRPDYAEAHNHLGHLLQELKRFPEAEASYQQALALRPDYAEAHNNLGYLLRKMNRFAEAEAAYRQALAIRPDYAEARWSLGLLLLYTGRWPEGWPLYEARHQGENRSGAHLIQPTFAYPQWQGESLEGRSILVHWEQGLGDQIQFVRYLSDLKARGARHVTLVCSPRLRSLFEGIDGADAVLTTDEAANAPAHDVWAFMLSLPLHLGTTLDTVPTRIPYLRPTAERLYTWESRLPTARPRIGLAWKGGTAYANDRNRSLTSLKELAPLWDVPGTHFVSLQKGQGEDEGATPPPDQPLTHLGSDVESFADDAAIIAQLDLVISVDTAIAHLAGALGKPCWILLPSVDTDWRWLDEGTDSPWYPGTTRLFRQSHLDDWAPTIGEVAEALRRFCQDRAA
ncbi:tetratricopeptide repeat protein [Dyella silvae]|uniref:tetratricopeptide repeat protein n=1 Tax=Dyella silvae TaxID=2994424 RepID=UPI00226408CC|nr:tetratricopeptide repeat protein [Dyella silvae]